FPLLLVEFVRVFRLPQQEADNLHQPEVNLPVLTYPRELRDELVRQALREARLEAAPGTRLKRLLQVLFQSLLLEVLYESLLLQRAADNLWQVGGRRWGQAHELERQFRGAL